MHRSVTKLFPFFLAVIFMVSFSCTDDAQHTNDESTPCTQEGNIVKEVTDVVGKVSYYDEGAKWMIIVSLSGTYDSQDLGVVCSDFPEEFQEVGLKVQFSGEYKEIKESNKGLLPGQTYYSLYLENITEVKGQ